MRVGASTSCFYPMLTELSLERLLKLGVKNIEVFINASSEWEPRFIKELKRAADLEGARIVSVHPYNSETEGMSFFGGYSRRFEDEVNSYRRYFEACAVMGAKIFVFHGARSFFKLENGFYFERFCRLRDIAAEYGVMLCQENVSRCHSGTREFIEDMKRAVPDVGFVLDVKQSARAGVSPFDMLCSMGENLVHLHLSDHDSSCDCLAPGEGSFDLKRFAGALKAAGYGGEVILELYSWNFDGDKKLSDGIKLFDGLMKE